MFVKKFSIILLIDLLVFTLFGILFKYKCIDNDTFMMINSILWILYMPYFAMKMRAYNAKSNISKNIFTVLIVSTIIESLVFTSMFVQLIYNSIILMICLVLIHIVDVIICIRINDKIIIGETLGTYKNDSKEKVVLSGCITTIYMLTIIIIVLISVFEKLVYQCLFSIILLIIIYILIDKINKVEQKKDTLLKIDFAIFVIYFVLMKNIIEGFTPISIFTIIGFLILLPYFRFANSILKKHLEKTI